nr:putative reverse transcriptase domain-containing protein [Tanacetum cinerariifolium]
EVSTSESTQEIPSNDPKEMAKEDVQNMLEIVLMSKFKVEALQLYTDCGVHHVSSTRGHDIFMLTDDDYPLSNAVMILMLSGKLQVEEDNEIVRDLVMKIFMEANKPKRKIRIVAYKLELPQQLSRVYNMFYVSNLKKCLPDKSLVISLEELRVDDKLHFVEEQVEVMDHEIKQLKRSHIPIIKVRWNSKRGPEFTREGEDQFKQKYPHLFTKTAPSSSTTS